MSIPTSDWIHPVRYLRARPFGSRLVNALAADIQDTGYPGAAGANRAMDILREEYATLQDQVASDVKLVHGIPIQSEEMVLAAAIASFTAAGRQVFVLPSSLVRALDVTDLGDVQLGDVLLPFPAFHLAFGDALAAPLSGTRNQVIGAYVRRLEAFSDIPAKLVINIVTRPLTAGASSLTHPWLAPLEPTHHVSFTIEALGSLERTLTDLLHEYYDFKAAQLSHPPVRGTAEENRALQRARDEGQGDEHTVSPHFRRAHWRRQRVGRGRAEVRLTRVKAAFVRSDLGWPAQGRLRVTPAPEQEAATDRPASMLASDRPETGEDYMDA